MSTPSSPPSSTCATAPYSDFPVKDAACYVTSPSGLPDTYADILKGCCGDAPVTKWADDCALYCLAADQSIAELQKCWQEGGVQARDIACNAQNNATATGEVSGTGEGGARETGTSASASAGAPASTESPGTAAVVVPKGVNKMGVGVLGVVFGSVILGTLL
ncbi:hypothetical protein BU23DRAFT_552812 [Bimuria novae-zelandiae CBS 107.79]|uniref:Uncharacterized protein n=1 Tax=Bimuria novae-zelandiae CBS 107.79 TaxID=1447943 RepID=A0A6A5VBX2_9PLEO|nr:hypothetical protein BU23DRAFT_552812 [Bimuria novae-zelandiae CBS 107.79]